MMTVTEKAGLSGDGVRGKTLLALGGGSGIGRAVALQAAHAGAKVVVAGRTLEKLEETAARADAVETPIETAVLDMTDADAVARFAEAAPSLDFLVVSASSAVHGPFAEQDIDLAQGMFLSKFWGPFRVAQVLLPKLRAGGSITLFSGVLSRRPGANCSALGAVNAAVEGLTRGMALELGPALRVNCISPGMVRSEAYDKMPAEKRAAMYQSTGESLPLGRVGTVDEIAALTLAVACNGFMTGQVVDIDGGHMIRQYATR